MADLTGKTVAGYPIEKLLAKGSYADTWRVQTSGDAMAVKILREELRTDPTLNGQVSKGWEFSRAAVHENLVTPFGAGIDPDVGAYCLQELIRGKPLRQNMLEGSKLAWRDFLIIAEQLYSAIHALHSSKVLHGDIWSGSILITQDQDLKLEGAGGLVLVARRPSEMISGQGLGYQAPEILQGSPISIEGDIYAAGGCLYAVLAGNDPYPPESPERLFQIVTDRKLPRVTALRDDLPPEVDELLGRVMAKDPTQRYGTAADVLADVRRLKDGKPMAPLKGGRPAATPLPSSRPSQAPSQPMRPKSSIAAAVGSRPPSAGRSGFGSAINAKKPISGLGSAVGTSGSALRSIKEGTAPGRIFGRLDTHVKSTIPQSDLEKRGDDLYHQGQLPLALNCWREAWDTNPHTALKAKLDLGERDAKRDSFNMALEEARFRFDEGDFAGAISRSREALISVEDDQQRQEVLGLERQAIESLEQEKYRNRIKMIVGGIVLLVVLIAAVIFMLRSKSNMPETVDTPVTPAPNSPQTPTPPPPRPSTATLMSFGETGATVTVQAPWSRQGDRLVYVRDGQIVASMTAGKAPKDATIAEVLHGIRSAQSQNETVVEEIENAFNVDGFPVAKSVVKYNGSGGPRLRYYFVIPGPDKVFRLVEVDGEEVQFNTELREQIVVVLRSWRYEKK